jgi:hypothetical protein
MLKFLLTWDKITDTHAIAHVRFSSCVNPNWEGKLYRNSRRSLCVWCSFVRKCYRFLDHYPYALVPHVAHKAQVTDPLANVFVLRPSSGTSCCSVWLQLAPIWEASLQEWVDTHIGLSSRLPVNDREQYVNTCIRALAAQSTCRPVHTLVVTFCLLSLLKKTEYEGGARLISLWLYKENNKQRDRKNIFTVQIPPWAPHTYDFVVLTSLTHPRQILLVALQIGK